jgi:hypothetical protein
MGCLNFAWEDVNCLPLIGDDWASLSLGLVLCTSSGNPMIPTQTSFQLLIHQHIFFTEILTP